MKESVNHYKVIKIGPRNSSKSNTINQAYINRKIIEKNVCKVMSTFWLSWVQSAVF